MGQRKGPYKREVGGSEAPEEDVRDEAEFREERRCSTADREGGRRGLERSHARNAALKSAKGKEVDSLLEPPEGMPIY